jgi:hypothetical protein
MQDGARISVRTVKIADRRIFMHKQYRVAKEWRSAVRMLFAALILAHTIGSAGQISPAQAAPASAPARSTNLRFELKPYPEGPLTISACEVVHFDVIVSKEEQVVLFGRERPVYSILSGVKIKGLVQNSNIGTLSPPKSSTGFENDSTASAGFTFTPKKDGQTTITFQATVGFYWVGDSYQTKYNAEQIEVPDKMVEVTVTPCKFKVTTISSWIGPVYNTIATSDEAEVVADAQGNFKGSATVNYATPITDSSCSFSASDTPGQVDWSGKIDSDQLVLTGTFQPSMTSFSASCPPAATYSKQQQWTADPLPIRVALSGGGFTQAQGAPGVSGSADIVVIPEECGGTASC